VGEFCLPCTPAAASIAGLGGSHFGETRDGSPAAICDGVFDEATRLGTEPYANFGWWKKDLPTHDAASGEADPLCPAERAHRAVFPLFMPCDPPESCLGNNTCASGYVGERCAQCTAGEFYRIQGECQKCPEDAWMLIAGFFGAAVVIVLFGFIFTRAKVNLGVFSIGVDYFQVISIFARSKVAWPPLIKQMMHYLTMFNLNLELMAPECSMPEFSFRSKWYAANAMPVAVAAVVVLGILGVWLFKCLCCVSGPKGTKCGHASGTIGMAMVLFYFYYLFLTRTIMDVFNCAPVS